MFPHTIKIKEIMIPHTIKNKDISEDEKQKLIKTQTKNESQTVKEEKDISLIKLENKLVELKIEKKEKII
jgi:hypothetical protein